MAGIGHILKFPQYSDEGTKMALIINVTATRPGAEGDTDLLEGHLTKCGFEVTLVQDLTKKGIVKKLKEWRELIMDGHSLVSCIFIAVMSEGREGDKFFDVNGEAVEFDKEILQPFSNIRCPELKKTPKIFLANFCRGSKGLDVAGPKEVTHGPYTTVYPPPTSKVEHSTPEWQIENVEGSRVYSGVHLVFATIKNHVAWRKTEGGAYLIEGFCNVLEQYANGSTPFEQLMKAVDLYFEEDLNGIQSLATEYIGVNKNLYLVHPNATSQPASQVDAGHVKQGKAKQKSDFTIPFEKSAIPGVATKLSGDRGLLQNFEAFVNALSLPVSDNFRILQEHTKIKPPTYNALCRLIRSTG